MIFDTFDILTGDITSTRTAANSLLRFGNREFRLSKTWGFVCDCETPSSEFVLVFSFDFGFPHIQSDECAAFFFCFLSCLVSGWQQQAEKTREKVIESRNKNKTSKPKSKTKSKPNLEQNKYKPNRNMNTKCNYKTNQTKAETKKKI